MMSRFLRRLGVTFKKKTLVAREQDRPDVSRHRMRWRTHQRRVDPTRLVFIDETWTKTNMTRLHGWAPKGERLVDKVPHGHWKTATFLAALRNDRIEAPCLFDGPINGERFHAYVEQFLAPTLKPDDVVVLDNLGSHKGKAVRRAIRDAGARLVFLPKYSPDLNPIEQVFAKFKTRLRKAGARSYEAVSQACAQILTQYRPKNAPHTSGTRDMRKSKRRGALGGIRGLMTFAGFGPRRCRSSRRLRSTRAGADAGRRFEAAGISAPATNGRPCLPKGFAPLG